MTDLYDELVSEFNKLHGVLKERAKKDDDFFSLLKRLEKDRIVSRYKDELHRIRKLCNLLVHEKRTVAYKIAAPSKFLVKQLTFFTS